MKFFFTTRSPFIQYAPCKRASGLGEALAQLGHSVMIAALDCVENRTRLTMEAPNCQHVFFPATNAIEEVRFKLKKIKSFLPDFLYAPTYEPRNFMGTTFLLPNQTKYLREVNELDSAFAEHKTIVRLAEIYSVYESDYIVCASINLLNHYKELSGKMRLKRKFIYSPYAYPDYLHSAIQSARNNKTISFLVSLTKEYGIYDFLEVAKDLVTENPMINVRIIGQGPEEQNTRNLVDSWNLSSNITFTGYIQESSLDEELSQADVFISPLRNTLQDFYRCPSKIYYYLAYQKPVVTCKFGEPQYALSDYGFYYEPGNIKSMNTAIKKALEFKGSPYPPNFIKSHSWKSRAEQIIKDLSS